MAGFISEKNGLCCERCFGKTCNLLEIGSEELRMTLTFESLLALEDHDTTDKNKEI